MDALVTHPAFGSDWLRDAELIDAESEALAANEVRDPLVPRWWVCGRTWESISGFNIPDGGYGEWVTMSVPLSMVRKLEPSSEVR